MHKICPFFSFSVNEKLFKKKTPLDSCFWRKWPIKELTSERQGVQQEDEGRQVKDGIKRS